MATSDLLNELNRENFKADADLEVKLSNIIIQQLDDVAGDVSGLAVKWYSITLCTDPFYILLAVNVSFGSKWKMVY